MEYANGDKYNGSFKQGKFSGQGLYRFEAEGKGKVYVGEWKNGLMDGNGKIMWVGAKVSDSNDEVVGVFKQGNLVSRQ